jgi:hypothetical protein
MITGKEALEKLRYNYFNTKNDDETEFQNLCDRIGNDLDVLEILKNILDANTLFRVFPYKTAKSFSDFIKTEEKVKEWLKNE